MKRLSKWLKKYFVPHKENDHKPHLLRHESMMFFFLLVIIIELGFLVQVFIVFDKTNFLAAVLPGVLTSLTNEERAENGAKPLVENELLNKAAQMKAEDMAANGYFAHTSPEGLTPWYWFAQVGYRYTMAGENLAVNFFESEEVAEAWMNSPTHRANIVKKEYTEIGIGVAKGKFEGKNTVYVAQLFGTPAFSAAPVETITPTRAEPEPTPAPTPKVEDPKPVPQPLPIPQPTPAPRTSPSPTPTVITVAPVSPSSTQVLGEEKASANIAVANKSMFQSIKSYMQKLMTSPRHSILYLYSIIGLFIILALLLVLFIKAEIRHPSVILRGFAMIAVIVALLFVDFQVLDFKTEVPSDNVTASIILAE